MNGTLSNFDLYSVISFNIFLHKGHGSGHYLAKIAYFWKLCKYSNILVPILGNAWQFYRQTNDVNKL